MAHQKLNFLRDAGSIAFLILFPHFFPLPFYLYAVVCLLLIWWLLRKDGRTFADLGLSKENLTLKAVSIGIASGLVWVCFMQLMYIPLIKYLFAVPDYTEYNLIRNDISKLIITLIAAWLIGGFYEEIVFRGYMQLIFGKWMPKRSGVFWGIVATSVLFGIYHWQQDIFGVIAATLGGFYWALLYRKCNHNLWIVMLSHAVFDTATLLLIYTGKFGNF